MKLLIYSLKELYRNIMRKAGEKLEMDPVLHHQLAE